MAPLYQADHGMYRSENGLLVGYRKMQNFLHSIFYLEHSNHQTLLCGTQLGVDKQFQSQKLEYILRSIVYVLTNSHKWTEIGPIFNGENGKEFCTDGSYQWLQLCPVCLLYVL